MAVAEVVRTELPAPRVLPAVQGFLVGLVLLLGFALPPLVQLKNVPAVRVIRRESGAPKPSAIAAYATGLFSLAALLVWQAGDLKLGLTVVGGFAVAVAVFFVVAWFSLRLLTGRRVIARMPSSILRYGLANLRRHARGNAVQIASLALGLTAVLLLTFTRNELVDAWRRSRAAGCAQPLPDRRAARAARAAAGLLLRAQRAGARPLPDGARTPCRRERRAGERGGLQRGAREAPGRARVQHFLHEGPSWP